MNNYNIPGVLIIDGHVQATALTQALGEKGIPIIIIDSNSQCIARYSKYCKDFFVSPHYLAPNFPEFLISLCKKKQLYGWAIFPCNDHIVWSLSQNKEMLSKFYKIISPSKDILSKIINKENLINIAIEVDVPVPKTIFPTLSNPVPTNIPYPAIIKGKEGQTFYKKTGKKGFLVKSINELSSVIKALKDVVTIDEIIIQEYVQAKGTLKVVSFTCFTINGDIKSYWIGDKVREHPVEFGTATFSRSIADFGLYPFAKKLMNALLYTGTCEIEFIIDSQTNTPKLIEINPRTWLWVGLAKDCGVDYANIMYSYLYNKDCVYPQSYKVDSGWVNIWTDLAYSLMGIIKGKISVSSFFSSYFKYKPKLAVFKWRDPAPFLMMTVLLPYIALKR